MPKGSVNSKNYNKKKSKEPLSDQQLIFVEAYCSSTNFNGTAAAKEAGYSTPATAANSLMNMDKIVKAIQDRLDERKKTFWITETDILERLWEEARNIGEGASHAARINALVWMGKHIGMWKNKEEKEDTQVTYNIIQYNTPQIEQITKAIEDNREEVESAKDSVSLDEDIIIADYSSTEAS